MTSAPFPCLALLGGSFNPVHAGHFRIAIEAHEALAPCRTLFLPCATPPHKPQSNLLPFDLRVALLEAGIAEMRLSEAGPERPAPPLRLEISRVEEERPGPSYTVDTLAQLARMEQDKRLCFILGDDDFLVLDTWHRWREIALLADLAVLPRGEGGKDKCVAVLHRLWPGFVEVSPPSARIAASFVLPGGGRMLYLPQPRLEISSSLVRQRWLERRSLDFLVPRGVQDLLHTHASDVAEVWQHCGG